MPAHALTLSFGSSLARHTHRRWLPQSPGALPTTPARDAARVRRVALSDFNHELAFLGRGRFYPARLLRGAQPWPARLFRVTQSGAEAFDADFNPPAAGLALRVERGDVAPANAALDVAGGQLLDWLGMEAPLASGLTDFDEPDAFVREDEGPDPAFYAAPRRVAHVDGVCSARLAALHGQLVPAGGRVLDLMAGWMSHVPAGHCRLTGLGMNEEEMMDNDRLGAYVVHDLNQAPAIPLPDESFDAVVCSLSLEYLTRPAAVLAEVRRILHPGGRCVISFSHRYFPPKAIRLWTRLHPMERLGWVLQLLHAAGFGSLETWVERGLRRDPADRYAPQLPEMDPLLAAWGSTPQAVSAGSGSRAGSGSAAPA
jgi:SAM-dependent methyltransferase